MDLEQRLRAHYQRHRPSEELTEAVRSLEGDTRPGSLVRGLGSIVNAWRASAMSRRSGIVLAGVLALVITAVFYQKGSVTERTQRTVKEVAMNHVTRLDLEYRDENIAGLNERMHQLPFSLAMPAQLRDDYAPLGSRYCSLAGHLAAHVKLKHVDTGEAVSLFVASLEKDLEALQGETAVVSGVDVEIWHEDGLFFAMASR